MTELFTARSMLSFTFEELWYAFVPGITDSRNTDTKSVMLTSMSVIIIANCLSNVHPVPHVQVNKGFENSKLFKRLSIEIDIEATSRGRLDLRKKIKYKSVDN